MEKFQTKATIKKFATQASKGGSIVVTLEVPLNEENSKIAFNQNGACIATLDFTERGKDDFERQMGFDFGEEDPDSYTGLAPNTPIGVAVRDQDSYTELDDDNKQEDEDPEGEEFEDEDPEEYELPEDKEEEE